MKWWVAGRKVYNYVRYDLKEIAFPSSLPDPPHLKKRPKLTWEQRVLVVKEAARLYAASWVRDIEPELRPDYYKEKNDEEDDDSPVGKGSKSREMEPSLFEDLAVASRGGMETLRPTLQRVYMTRASAYRDALKSFIIGYREGIQQAMEAKEEQTMETNEESNIKKEEGIQRKTRAAFPSNWNSSLFTGIRIECSLGVLDIRRIVEFAACSQS